MKTSLMALIMGCFVFIFTSLWRSIGQYYCASWDKNTEGCASLIRGPEWPQILLFVRQIAAALQNKCEECVSEELGDNDVLR